MRLKALLLLTLILVSIGIVLYAPKDRGEDGYYILRPITVEAQTQDGATWVLNTSNVILIMKYQNSSLIMDPTTAYNALSGWADPSELTLMMDGVVGNVTVEQIYIYLSTTTRPYKLTAKYGFYVDTVNGVAYLWLYRKWYDYRDYAQLVYYKWRTVTPYEFKFIFHPPSVMADLLNNLGVTVAVATISQNSIYYLPEYPQATAFSIHYYEYHKFSSGKLVRDKWNYYVGLEQGEYGIISIFGVVYGDYASQSHTLNSTTVFTLTTAGALKTGFYGTALQSNTTTTGLVSVSLNRSWYDRSCAGLYVLVLVIR